MGRHHPHRGFETVTYMLAGRMRHHDAPDWKALEALLGADELCARFMWMYDVVLEDGTILHAYKHR